MSKNVFDDLKNKVVVVTGGTRGIGFATVKAFLQQGSKVVMLGSRKETVDKALHELSEYKDTIMGRYIDLNDLSACIDLLKEVLQEWGSVDVLINNAGYGYRSSVEEGDIDDVNLLFNTNFFGPIELIKEVLPQMRANKNGAIVNVSSIAAVRSGVGSGYYAASKAALELMTDGLAKELKPLGIKVMIAQPGSFRTNFYDTSLKGTKNKIDDYNETAGKTRKENVVNHKNQPGDPDKGGQVIVDTIEKDNYPFRLLLGSDATKIVASALEERIQEIETWKNISSQSDFE